MPKQDCPLCGSPAGFEIDGFGRRKKFDCPKCKYFHMHTATEKSVMELSKNDRKTLSKRSAQCTNDEAFVISTNGNKAIKGVCENCA